MGSLFRQILLAQAGTKGLAAIRRERAAVSAFLIDTGSVKSVKMIDTRSA